MGFISDQIMKMAQANSQAQPQKKTTAKQAVVAIKAGQKPSPEVAGPQLNWAKMTQHGVALNDKDTTTNTSKEENKQVTTVKEPGQLTLTSPQFGQMVNTIQQNEVPGEQGQIAANDELAKMIKAYSETGGKEVDVRPFATGVDQIFGTNISAKQTAPTDTPQMHAEKLMALKDKLAGNYAQQAQREAQLMNLLKIQQPGFTTVQDLSALTQGLQNQKQQGTTINVQTPKPVAAGADKSDARRMKFAEDLQKARVPDLQEAISQVDAVIPGGLNGWKGQDIPGFTPGDKFKGILTWGVANSDEAKAVKGSVQSLVNVLLNMRSGSAVTDNEGRRLGEELGSTVFKNQKELVNGLRRGAAFVTRVKSNLEAGAGRAVVQDYNQEYPQVQTTPVQAGASLQTNTPSLLNSFRGLRK